MVDLSAGGPDGPLEHGFSNSVFVFPGIITFVLVVFFGYKLYRSLMDKERKKEDKKKLKIQKKKQK